MKEKRLVDANHFELVHGYQRRGKNIGTMTHGTFDLNFCPVCGTKLEEE